MLYEWFKHIAFAYPFSFSLFILLPLMVWWYVKKNSTASFTVSTAG
jgi:Ca-activated chloride channel family protein